MAIVTATITVDFIANYAGSHRVCFRIQGSGDPYDCSTVVNCAGGATTCQAIINTPVNTTSCDGIVVFEGYVQAACEDILSTNGRLAWTADFVPNVICDRFEILCQVGPVVGILTSAGGILYDLADSVVVTRNGADIGVGDATVSIATLGDGAINSITGLLAPGTLYAASDTIDITGGGGGAGAIIQVDSVDGGGGIVTFSVIAVGAGYFGGPFTFTTVGGFGSGASFTLVEGVDYNDFGSITGFTISVPGEYSITPLISIVTGTGSGGVFTSVLGGCPIWTNVGLDCIGGDQVDIADLALAVGDIFGTCIEGGLATAVPARYTATEIGCCIAEDSVNTVCTDVHIENLSGGPVDVHVTLCGGDDDTVTIPNGVTEALCLVEDGWIDPYIVGVTIADQGTPCT